jgi:glucose/arabinose dehydrogenase
MNAQCMRPNMTVSRLVAALAAVIACTNQVPPQPRDPGLVEHDVDGEKLYLRPGFAIAEYARLAGARYLQIGPDGVAYASTLAGDRIWRLPDADRNGVADSAVAVVSGLTGAFGIAFRGDTLYIASEGAVQRLAPGATTPQTVVPGLPTGGHSTRTIVFGPDGKLYLAVGSSCNVCDESDARRAAVTRYEPDGGNPQPFATGLRNSVGLAFHPTTGELWATNNDRDNIGPTAADTDERPPERLNILRQGGFYGWPQCYLPGQRNPEYPAADCRAVEPAALTFTAHSAPLGMRFYQGTQFPPAYQGDAFVAFHGSWNRTVPTGAKVVRVRVANGRPQASEDFVTGWQRANGRRWGRPVDVLPLRDGSLLISDDAGDRIWRVTYQP